MNDAPCTWRILSYNVKSGLHHPDGLEAVARVIAACDADVVALQEVDDGTTRSGAVDQSEWLRERLGYAAAAFGAATPWADGGHYGLALLSRAPLRDVMIERLWVPRAGEAPAREIEPRIVMAARLDVGAREVCVANVHLGLSAAQRQVQTEQAVRFLQRYSGGAPLVVLGDFNANPDAVEMAAVHRAWRDAMASTPLSERITYPSRAMRDAFDGTPAVCDYVFVSEAVEASVFVVADASGASDHDPVLAQCVVSER